MAGLELHTWFSRIDPEPDARKLGRQFHGSEATLKRSVLNYPDFVVFDLDPYLYSGKEGRGEEPELHRPAFTRTRARALAVRELRVGRAAGGGGHQRPPRARGAAAGGDDRMGGRTPAGQDLLRLQPERQGQV